MHIYGSGKELALQCYASSIFHNCSCVIIITGRLCLRGMIARNMIDAYITTGLLKTNNCVGTILPTILVGQALVRVEVS